MANQDSHNIAAPERQWLQSRKQPGQEMIPATRAFGWWGWIWVIVGIVVFLWLSGWGL